MTLESSGAGAPQDWFAFTARRLVAAEFRIAESALASASRAKQEVAFARQVAMYLAHVCYQLTYQEVADAFGRERTTVSHACAVVEDARDEGNRLDERLCKLEERLRALAKLRTGWPTAMPPSEARSGVIPFSGPTGRER
ncbi:helix-turn-helix domain-containing protein [Parvularcula dongshanensis]|uniref:DNA repair ATPase RecN n=1 Tax=Parvularcula dongshanensis TaxID=1173995 RepID=A0A840I2M2_9PROT|nr:helix-turn-helix domain-containing protein [Parvularcula dongshanensis]MBB4658531.1 DNA repair ATPase RecN [Parvularcula dongshanensis]